MYYGFLYDSLRNTKIEYTTVYSIRIEIYHRHSPYKKRRLNHLLKAKPHLYIDQSPMVIPIQGEHPHGLFHVMHAQWRLYIRFLKWCP